MEAELRQLRRELQVNLTSKILVKPTEFFLSSLDWLLILEVDFFFYCSTFSTGLVEEAPCVWRDDGLDPGALGVCGICGDHRSERRSQRRSRATPLGRRHGGRKSIGETGEAD